MSLRARRIASDEALACARNLRLGNPQAKLILSMVTLYVDGEGCCFVSIPALAEDCEMSPDTVRRRLAWLESIGVITRTPQWIDAQGQRKSTGPGRRSSDLIELMIPGVSPSNQPGLDPSSGEISPSNVPVAESVSPGSQQGSSPRLALRRPSHCGKGLISEPEPEKNRQLVEVTDEEALRAWDAHGRATTGRSYPRNKKGAWYHPSFWPPGHDTETIPASIGRKA
jgi:Helix-turn-helix domain